MNKTLVTALAFSLAASAALAGGPGPAKVESDVENPFIVAPQSSMNGTAIAAAVIGLLVVGALAGNGGSGSSSTTTTGAGS
ncbi:MAG: hypothetical protein KDK26_13265 [Roseivivax sp.]|nr:hypothetical protein [Roseivivax sp.]